MRFFSSTPSNREQQRFFRATPPFTPFSRSKPSKNPMRPCPSEPADHRSVRCGSPSRCPSRSSGPFSRRSSNLGLMRHMPCAPAPLRRISPLLLLRANMIAFSTSAESQPSFNTSGCAGLLFFATAPLPSWEEKAPPTSSLRLHRTT